MSAESEYETVVGLEVHVQLLTRTKTFCACRVVFGDPPNTHTCPVCLGLPGSLPVLNEGAVALAVRAALALSCTAHEESIFARKNYFYPDLPKGYQISQYERPLATEGHLEIEAPSAPGGKRRVGITRIHMEEDAGKNVHAEGESVVDLNRAGTPLAEIVSEPDLRGGAEAAEYLKRLREVLMFLGVCDGNLEQGSFRCDANVSVRRPGGKLGTRVELKNINSFKFVADAIDGEARRQILLLERGEKVRQQTRGYNAEKRESYLLRDKENDAGYRYFPEPDLPPLRLEAAYLEEARRRLPELPAEKRRRYVDRLSLTPYAASVVTGHPGIAAYFEEAVALGADPVKAANFLGSEVLKGASLRGLEASFPIPASALAELLALVDAGTISGKQAKEVFAASAETGRAPGEIVRERGMRVMGNESELFAMAEELVRQNPKQAAGYRLGKTNLLGFFVGQIMKKTGGSADPSLVNAVLKKALEMPEPGSVPNPPSAAGPGGPGAEAAAVEVSAETRRDPGAEARARATAAKGPSSEGEARPSKDDVGKKAASSPPEEPGSGEAPTVSFEDFAKLDIRVGVVREAARVPRKDKLLDLRVDVGDPAGPRRIVAGLALTFSPESLVGRRVLVVCNLAPRAFSKELVSHGMILATGPSDALELPTVGEAAPPGSRVG